MTSNSTTFPPTDSPPYGQISLLPKQSTFQSHTNLTVTFTSSNLDSNDTPTTLQTTTEDRLSWKHTQSKPSVSFTKETDYPDATYTLLMTDPDAPNPQDPRYAYWRHWIQPSLGPSGTSTREPLTEYLGPGRKEPSADPHRYILLLYREPPTGHHFHSLTSADVGAEHFEARRAFDAKGWVEENELVLVAVEWFWGTG